MKRNRAFSTCVREYVGLVRDYDLASVERREQLLANMSSVPIGKVGDVIQYHNALLFTIAYAPSNKSIQLAEKELSRVANHVAHVSGDEPHIFENSGLAGSVVYTPLSLRMTRWMIQRYGTSVAMLEEGLNDSAIAEALMFALDPVEYEMLGAGETDWYQWGPADFDDMDWYHRTLPWLVGLADSLPGGMEYKATLYDKFGVTVEWTTTPEDPSHSLTRAPLTSQYIHSNIQKRSSLGDMDLLSEPRRVKLDERGRTDLIETARSILCSMERETDPTTYASMDEVMYFEMGRGLSVALFPMVAEQKMSVQSYVGHMVFKNGVACAYGGSWLLFHEAGFGVNIFPAMRGGESAAVVSELMRLYRHVFNVVSFTIDPYQIGYGNSDGIASAAFWFYYRLGFRPEQKHLIALASKEVKKLFRDSRNRTSKSVLKTLSESTMRWNDPACDTVKPITAVRIASVVSSYVKNSFDGNRLAATKTCIDMLRRKTKQRVSAKSYVGNIVVLLAACGYIEEATPAELRRFVKAYEGKAEDEAGYVRTSQKFPLLEDLIRSSEQKHA